MKTDYDVIVIGAGNGGLAAAVTAAKLNHKVLLVERHNLPGGAATSFTRGRFEFEPSLHELAGYGPQDNPGNIRQFFDWAGIDVQFHAVPDAYRMINTGKDKLDIRMPTGIQNFMTTLIQAVPGSQASVQAFFKIAIENAQVFAQLSAHPEALDPATLATQHPLFAKYGHQPYQRVLQALDMPAKAQEILLAYWCYIGIPSDEFEFAYFASMLVSYVTYSAYIPQNRSHEISSALVQALQANGGTAWFNTEVTQLLTAEGAVVGVQIGDRKLYAHEVIADLLPDTVYSHLLPAEMVPTTELKKANARELGTSGFLVYLGLNRSATELGIHDYSTFIARDWDTRHQFAGMHQLHGNDFMIMNCLNVANPTCSPAGTSILYATQLFFGDSWDQVRPQDYPHLKTQLARDVITRYEQATGVHIQDSIEEIEVATPVTFARYLRAPEGDIYGYYGQPWDQMVARSLTAAQEDEPLPHLHFCGGAGHMLDGYSSAYASGQFAARQASHNLQKEVL
ncbi:C-3',4' desaturase CrtD [Levilactobacillus zymae]|uniref:C-3',4' desaturase CrtD n=1 Tax=Levilactobacillus zymae TaxID=267363 RepID=A0ABQ0X3M9_9LACO|nr:NAD(P)/FAD-dependent oxidoreductase [Levilactobacillus zymae]KRL08734.1 GDP dissociation inhibitor [Levilactobacillus zymae DSM 19395]QFR61571.1 FAD-dependent oxidoreductase [Levilactobacillus zymae]GEO72138.1 C-3',4' desaturase CrtD [Levilactobacillus zymae]